MKNKFDVGTKVIWDSGFGYDLGYYLGESEVLYGHDAFDNVTGYWVQGELAVQGRELIEFNEENYNQMVERYGYEKKFPEKV